MFILFQSAWPVLCLGFLGSLHCVGMCGPLVASCASYHRDYFFARLLSYTMLGFCAGLANQLLFVSFFKPFFPYLAFVAFFMCVFQSVSLFFPDFYVWLRKILHRLMKMKVCQKMQIQGFKSNKRSNFFMIKLAFKYGRFLPISSGSVLGLLSSVLPCGFLYSAVALSMSAPFFWMSGLCMAGFALATAPALYMVQMVNIFKKYRIFFGCFSLFILCVSAHSIWTRSQKKMLSPTHHVLMYRQSDSGVRNKI